jgi:cation:H+ antiporter
MHLIESLSLVQAIAVFVVSTILIAIGGTFLTKEADRLADVSGLGEALVGAIFLGAITSMSGIVTSFTAALEGHPHLSVSNAIGGIAAQTVFLAIADITYKRANLEHAAASLSNIMQTVVLMFFLVFMLIINKTPEIYFLGIHPGTFIMITIYVISQKMIAKSKEFPMWRAVETDETKKDIPDQQNIKKLKLHVVILRFLGLGILIAISGYMVAQSSITIASETGISENVIGAMLTAISSSLPELIVSVSAVRQRALTLAISNIVGGNTFDVLFVAFSDMSYQDGSIMHTFQDGQTFLITLTLLLTIILTLGLLFREKKGFAKIGWESVLMIVVFLGGYAMLFFI